MFNHLYLLVTEYSALYSTMHFAQRIMDEISRSMGVVLLDTDEADAEAIAKKKKKKFKRLIAIRGSTMIYVTN